MPGYGKGLIALVSPECSLEDKRNCSIRKGYGIMKLSVSVKSGGRMAKGLRELRGKCRGVVAALSTMLLFIAGCGGSKPATPTPAFTPGAGTYTTVQNVTVSDTNQNAVLYCTNDGSAPTASSPQCANPTKVSQSQTLKAIAIAPGMDPSVIATAAFTIGALAPVPVVTAVTPGGRPVNGWHHGDHYRNQLYRRYCGELRHVSSDRRYGELLHQHHRCYSRRHRHCACHGCYSRRHQLNQHGGPV
jgi:hypothetical protein